MNISSQIYYVFNNEGKLLPLEYGLEAVYSSYQTVSVLAEDSIILVSKKVPKMPLMAESHNSIFKVGTGLYMNITGIPADIDYVVDRAISLASSVEYNLGCKVSPDIFTKSLADKFQVKIQKSSHRNPAFATSIAGFEGKTPMLFYTDMSAVEYPCFACASGEDYQKMIKYLEKHYKKTDKKSAIQIAITALLQSIGKDAEAHEIQVGIVNENGLEELSTQQIDQMLQIIAESY